MVLSVPSDILTRNSPSQKNSRWEESISLSKQDKLFKDAMETAAVSNETSVAEELLSYFVDIGNKDCFAATLYVCFDLLRPDVVAELVSSCPAPHPPRPLADDSMGGT
jgi:hypothetical protein